MAKVSRVSHQTKLNTKLNSGPFSTWTRSLDQLKNQVDDPDLLDALDSIQKEEITFPELGGVVGDSDLAKHIWLGVKEKRAFDHTDSTGFQFGESGYVDIMNAIQEMLANGYGVVDIMLSIGERFDKVKATAVLEDARARGIL